MTSIQLPFRCVGCGEDVRGANFSQRPKPQYDYCDRCAEEVDTCPDCGGDKERECLCDVVSDER